MTAVIKPTLKPQNYNACGQIFYDSVSERLIGILVMDDILKT